MMNYQEKVNKMREERDLKILKLREKKATLQEIGDKFGISKEAVRKVLKKSEVNPVDKR